jgi:hypothetical protein
MVADERLKPSEELSVPRSVVPPSELNPIQSVCLRAWLAPMKREQPSKLRATASLAS